MPELKDAQVLIGVAGLNGSGITEGEKLDITTRLSDIEATTIPAVLNDLSDVSGTPATGDVLMYDGGWTPAEIETSATVTFNVPFLFDGAGSEIGAGVRGEFGVDFAFTITGYRITALQTGSVSIEVWKDAWANYPPTSADTILTATLSSASKAVVTGLSIAVSAGDVLMLNVPAPATTITQVGLSLTCTRTI